MVEIENEEAIFEPLIRPLAITALQCRYAVGAFSVDDEGWRTLQEKLLSSRLESDLNVFQPNQTSSR